MPWLEWHNRNDDLKAAAKTPYRLLQPVQSLSHGDEDAPNMLIQGDNLEALKALLPYYAGQVKCIFIDPPYNTKSAFEHYDDNLEHAQWLSMIYPRLVLLRELLAEDGSIWVTIDDNEAHYLKVVMDEVFGRSKFIASNVWQKRYSRENRQAIGDVHDYILVYSKQPAAFKSNRNLVPMTEAQAKVYRNPNNDPRGRWRPVPMTAQAGHATAEQFYEVVTPAGVTHRPPKGRCWGVARATYERLLVESGEEGETFEVVVKGAIQPESVEAIAKVFTGKSRTTVRTSLEQHNARARLRETPAQKGVKFDVPQLSIRFGERVVPVENDLLVEDGFWDPADTAGKLDTLTFDTRTQTWEINIGTKSVKMDMVQEPQAKYLSGLTGDWDEAELLVWLEAKVVQKDVRQEAMVEWIAQAIAPLRHKGYSLGQLVRGRFIIQRRLAALLQEARAKRGNQVHRRLFELDEVVVDPGVVFQFSPLAYPMSSPCPAPQEWPKHYYAVPGDLPFRRKDGTLAEEYRCALAIERNPDVEVWVRNLAHPTQFRLPTATGSTYPDFIAKLKDGRIFVIEYKGDDRYDHPKNQAKRAVGELWARKYPAGLYLMPREKDDAGRDIDEQIAHAIAAGR